MERKGPRRSFLVAGAVAVLAWLALFPITSVDAYYHLAIGKRILESGEIPRRGVGSATFGEAPWHDNEWGFQAVAAALGRSERDPSGVLVLTPGGRAALVLLRALVLAATLGLVSATLARGGVSTVGRALAIWLLAFLTFGNLFWDLRPQIASYLLFAAVFWFLERDREGARWAVPGLLTISALWANLHATFHLGVAVVGLEALGELWDARRTTGERRRALRLAIASAGMIAAALLNPHGWRQITHPFVYLLSPEIHAGNVEWIPPDLLRLPLLLLAVAWAGTALASDRARRSADLLRVALFGALFTTALRHLPFLAIVLAVAGARSAASVLRAGRFPRLASVLGKEASPSRRAAAGFLLAAGIVGLSGAKFVGPLPRFEERPVRPMPESAVRFLAREGIPGSGLNAYRFGGFLMFRLYPEERVFMDGRNDLYGRFRNEVYNPILRAEPGWRAALRDAVARWDLGWILVDAAEPIASALPGEPGWISGSPPRVDGGDGDGIVLYLRDTEANRERLARWPGTGNGR